MDTSTQKTKKYNSLFLVYLFLFHPLRKIEWLSTDNEMIRKYQITVAWKDTCDEPEASNTYGYLFMI